MVEEGKSSRWDYPLLLKKHLHGGLGAPWMRMTGDPCSGGRHWRPATMLVAMPSWLT